jgi:hypothetical protein
MEIVEIVQAERLSNASKSNSNWVYLLFQNVGNPRSIQLTKITGELEQIVDPLLESKKPIDIRFPDRKGIIYHKETDTYYEYQNVNIAEIIQISNRLKRYTLP